MECVTSNVNIERKWNYIYICIIVVRRGKDILYCRFCYVSQATEQTEIVVKNNCCSVTRHRTRGQGRSFEAQLCDWSVTSCSCWWSGPISPLSPAGTGRTLHRKCQSGSLSWCFPRCCSAPSTWCASPGLEPARSTAHTWTLPYPRPIGTPSTTRRTFRTDRSSCRHSTRTGRTASLWAVVAGGLAAGPPRCPPPLAGLGPHAGSGHCNCNPLRRYKLKLPK